MNIKIFGLIVAVMIALSFPASGQNACTVVLAQIHFPVSQSTNTPVNLLVVKDMSNNVVQLSSLPTQIVDRLTTACQSILPSISISDVPARDFLGYFIDMPFLDVEGSLGLGTLRSIHSGDPSSLPWVVALPVTNCIISASGVTNVYFIEMIDRLAQFMDMETGVMSSGNMIYGYSGNWPTNYIPDYTLILNVRYEE